MTDACPPPAQLVKRAKLKMDKHSRASLRSIVDACGVHNDAVAQVDLMCIGHAVRPRGGRVRRALLSA